MRRVKPEAVVRNAVTVVAAALLPGAVVGVPRTRRLSETAAHLPGMLWDAAGVDAAIGGRSRPYAGVINAAIGLLRP